MSDNDTENERRRIGFDRRKFLQGIGAGAVGLSGVTAFSGSAVAHPGNCDVVVDADTSNTHADYHTIQEAINKESTGTTICVREGTYVESVYLKKDRVTLKSLGKPRDTVIEAPDDNSDPSFNAAVPLYIAEGADDVTIDGFKITNEHGPRGVVAGNAGSSAASGADVNNLTFKNNIIGPIEFDTTSISSGGNEIRGIFVRSRGNGFTFENNTVRDLNDTAADGAGASGVSVLQSNGGASAHTGVEIKNNVVQSVSSSDSGFTSCKGIHFDGKVDGAVIENNEIHGIGDGTSAQAVGIELTEIPSTPRRGPQDFEIVDNDIRGLNADDDEDFSPVADDDEFALFVGGYEDLGANDDGSQPENAGDVHQNNLGGAVWRYSQDQSGFDSSSADKLDAENNWWNNPSGPSGDAKGNGEEVVGEVDFKPWLRRPA